MNDLPDKLVDLCDELGLDYPEPGERWEFVLEDPPNDVSKRLKRLGCRLQQEVNAKYVDGVPDSARCFEYMVPEPGWPLPLGYITTDEPRFVSPQVTVRNGMFTGNVRGSIPDSGDCDRHPDLPENAYALARVSILSPDRDVSFRKLEFTAPEDRWTAKLQYKQAVGSSTVTEEVYSTRLGRFPRVLYWKHASGYRNKRVRYEFFDTLDAAVRFIEDRTGLPVEEVVDRDRMNEV